MARTVDNCTVIKRGIRMGLGEPIRFRAIGKCAGYRSGEAKAPECALCRFLLPAKREKTELHATHDPWTIGKMMDGVRLGRVKGVGKRFAVESEQGRVEVEILIRNARMTWYDRESETLHKYHGNVNHAVAVLARLGVDLATVRGV